MHASLREYQILTCTENQMTQDNHGYCAGGQWFSCIKTKGNQFATASWQDVPKIAKLLENLVAKNHWTEEKIRYKGC